MKRNQLQRIQVDFKTLIAHQTDSLQERPIHSTINISFSVSLKPLTSLYSQDCLMGWAHGAPLKLDDASFWTRLKEGQTLLTSQTPQGALCLSESEISTHQTTLVIHAANLILSGKNNNKTKVRLSHETRKVKAHRIQIKGRNVANFFALTNDHSHSIPKPNNLL